MGIYFNLFQESVVLTLDREVPFPLHISCQFMNFTPRKNYEEMINIRYQPQEEHISSSSSSSISKNSSSSSSRNRNTINQASQTVSLTVGSCGSTDHDESFLTGSETETLS